jgi:beta-RFAP synthase
MTRVTSGSRLHFGLLRLPPPGPWPPGRYFGGVGLMVREPAVTVAVEPAADWSATGPMADRALAFASACVDTEARFAVRVESCPIDHTGLGVGTQLALATAAAVGRALGRDEPAEELARRVGRGVRSAIGVHGFARGGFLVDGGKRAPDELAPLVARIDFPDDWRVVLFDPPGARRFHGVDESAAFAGLSATADDAMARLVLFGMLPALADRDLPAFGDALTEYNARAGELFRPAQGGTYSTPQTAEVVAWLRRRGVRGAGQSSWGPTAFAVVGDAAEAAALVAASPVPAHATAARNGGAV